MSEQKAFIDLSDHMDLDGSTGSSLGRAPSSSGATRATAATGSTDGSRSPATKRRRLSGPYSIPTATSRPSGPKVQLALLCEGPESVLDALSTHAPTLDKFGDPEPICNVRVLGCWLKVFGFDTQLELSSTDSVSDASDDEGRPSDDED